MIMISAESVAAELRHILEHRQLSALFQPIVHLRRADVRGHEGLIRGPSDSPLHAPASLFRAAAMLGAGEILEGLCIRTVLQSYAAADTDSHLFLNLSPDFLLALGTQRLMGEFIPMLPEAMRRRLVLELTEQSRLTDFAELREYALILRRAGLAIAMDDLGEGFSGLRLWSELRPDYVKIDKHFIQGINLDSVKQGFVRSVAQMAREAGCELIAEGIETEAEFLTVQSLGIVLGQGYFFARPQPRPVRSLGIEVTQVLRLASAATAQRSASHAARVERLAMPVVPVAPNASAETAFARFEAEPRLVSLPVVADGKPLGLISRYTMVDRFARLYRRELYGKKPCTVFAETDYLVVDARTTLHELSDRLINTDIHHLANGFIIVEGERYVGVGSAHDLLREITQMQLLAARYANPLTQLPGNVPIHERVSLLLEQGESFTICYADLDHFKPFNDVYGFRRGDDLIQATARLLAQVVEHGKDFLGHIGGDDFIVIFQSPDWEARCQRLMAIFGREAPALYDAGDRLRGGIESEDRQGRLHFFPVASLSIGAVQVQPGHFADHHEVAAAASAAKREAKKTPGNSLFVERRANPVRVAVEQALPA